MRSTISRRRALAALAAAFAILGLHPRPAISEPTLVRVSIIPIYSVATHFAAEAQGYFAAENIAVTTQPVQTGAVGIPGLMSGAFDVLYTNTVSVLTALERGIDLRIVAEAPRIPTSPPDALALFQRKGDSVRTGKDVEGKVVAINAKFTAQWLSIQKWVTVTGGDVGKITYREIPLPSMIDALKTKQVDLAFLLDPYMTAAFEDPALALAAWPSSTSMPGLSSSVWVVSGKFADTKPDVLRAYMRAFFKGGQWVNENLGKKPYIELVAGFTKMSPERLAKMQTVGQRMEIEPAAINGVAKVMKEFGLLKTDVDVTDKVFR